MYHVEKELVIGNNNMVINNKTEQQMKRDLYSQAMEVGRLLPPLIVN